jgi:hypothetical protein
MELRKVSTASELRSLLSAQGLPNHAIECLVEETAAARHEGRVQAAIVAARKYVRETLDVVDDPEVRVEFEAAAVLIADTFGVGGHADVTGAATSRHPGLEGLGKGRKQATDGDAWSAAIREAGMRILRAIESRGEWSIRAYPIEGSPVVALWCEDSTGNHLASGSFGLDVIGQRWCNTVVREGLRRAYGLGGWFELAPISFSGEPLAWAKAVDSVHEAIEKTA